MVTNNIKLQKLKRWVLSFTLLILIGTVSFNVRPVQAQDEPPGDIVQQIIDQVSTRLRNDLKNNGKFMELVIDGVLFEITNNPELQAAVRPAPEDVAYFLSMRHDLMTETAELVLWRIENDEEYRKLFFESILSDPKLQAHLTTNLENKPEFQEAVRPKIDYNELAAVTAQLPEYIERTTPTNGKDGISPSPWPPIIIAILFGLLSVGISIFGALPANHRFKIGVIKIARRATNEYAGD